MKADTLISLGLLCDDGCTISLDNQYRKVQKNGQEIMKGTRNKKTGMWEVTLETQQLEFVTNNILSQKTKPEISQYLHVALLIPTTESLLKAISESP